MKEKNKMILRITAFVLTLIMLMLFSVGTILTAIPNTKTAELSQVQYRTEEEEKFTYKLKTFEFVNNIAYKKQPIKIKIEEEVDSEEDYEEDFYGLWAKNINNNSIYYSSQMKEESDNNVYSFVSTNTAPGTYQITGLITGVRKKNSFEQTEYVYLNLENCTSAEDCYYYDMLNKQFVVSEDEPEDTSPVFDYVMALYENNPTVSVGDKLNVSFGPVDFNDEVKLDRKPVSTVMLSYTNATDGSVLNVYLKGLSEKDPYIIIPSTATPGTYNINYGYLTFTDGTSARYKNTVHSQGQKIFSYNVSFTVKEKKKDTSKYNFNNELYDNTIKTNLETLDQDAIITIDANNAPIINSEIFQLIRNTKRTLIIEYNSSRWVFSGKDINNPKTIDVSTIVMDLTSNNEYYNQFLKTNVKSPSAMLKFQDNGDLPGKVLIKIDSESIDSYLKNPDKAYVYYYKEDSDKLIKVAMEIQKNNKFYEFYINHNSKYIISSEEINTKAVSDDFELLTLNNPVVTQSNNNTLIIYILATACGVLAIGLLSVIIIKGKKVQAQQ